MSKAGLEGSGGGSMLLQGCSSRACGLASPETWRSLWVSYISGSTVGAAARVLHVLSDSPHLGQVLQADTGASSRVNSYGKQWRLQVGWKRSDIRSVSRPSVTGVDIQSNNLVLTDIYGRCERMKDLTSFNYPN